MTEDLSPAALTALWIYVAAAGPHDTDPRFGVDARLSLLLGELLDRGGEWTDVEALLALDEPALAFLDRYSARTVWRVLGGVLPLFEEPVLFLFEDAA